MQASKIALARNLLSLFVIAIILVGGKVLLEEVKKIKSARSDLITLSQSINLVLQYAQSASAASGIRVLEYRGASVAALDGRIAEANTALQSSLLKAGKPILTFPLPTQGDIVERVVDHYKRGLEGISDAALKLFGI